MEAKKAAIEDWFRSGAGVCKQPIEKVSLDPDTKHMFLDINRMVDLGERLKFLGDKLVPLDHFLESLFMGEYHVDTIEELSSLLERTKNQRDQLEVRMRLDLGLIEDDMGKLCRKIVSRVEDYFAELTSRLKQIHIDNNIDSGLKLEKFERLLEKKIENKATFGSGTDSFELKNFYSKFKIMQKEPEKLERFFQGMIRRKFRYDTFREDKDLQQFQHLFREESSFEENMITYLENKHKLQRIEDTLPVYASSDSDSAEERFVDNVLGLIDKSIGNVRHFDIRAADEEEEERAPLSASKKPQQIGTFKPFEKSLMTPLSKVQRSRSKEKQASAKPKSEEQSPAKSLKSPALKDSNRLELTTGSKETQESLVYLQGARELREGLNKDVNAEALAAGFELSGADWTKNSFEDAVAFLEELQQVEELVITLAEIPSIGKGRMKLLGDLIASKKSLKNLDLCFAKSKLNKQDLEEVQNCVQSLQRLQFFSLNIDGVSPREEEFTEYCRLFELLPLEVTSIRFSCAHNEFSIQHIHTLCKSLQDRELQKLGLCLSGCGLQKDASLHLFDWLQFGIFVEDKLDLDFSVNYLEKEEKQALVAVIEKYNTLKELKLNLTETELEDSTLDKVSSALLKFDFLETVKIRICGNPLSSENFELLLRRLSKLPNLTKVLVRARRIKSFPARLPQIERAINEMKVYMKDVVV